jgi:ethanolamine-phosphate cytidylyltransferase
LGTGLTPPFLASFLQPEGNDVYAYAKSLGLFKMFKRTEGVSTTDIVGRMLLMTREHHMHLEGSASPALSRRRTGSFATGHDSEDSDDEVEAVLAAPDSSSRFLPTARRIRQFSSGRAPGPSDVVVYICGAFDLFNAGHIAALQEARKFGTFLLVGVHDDDTVNARRGGGFPVLNLHERTLSVLSCRYADEVVIGAPGVITEDLIRTFNISIVARGSISDTRGEGAVPPRASASATLGTGGGGEAHAGAEAEGSNVAGGIAGAAWDGKGGVVLPQEHDAYALPSAKGILRTFQSPRELLVTDIIDRVMANRAQYQARFDKKHAAEKKYHSQKEFVQEA